MFSSLGHRWKLRPGAVLVLVWAGLCLGTFGLAAPIDAEELTSAVPPGQPLLLHYTEASAPLDSYPLRYRPQTSPFAKEPDVAGRKPIRGRLLLDDTDNTVAFLWDTAKTRLYLDLNRNQDLTDDSDGIINARDERYSYYQTFQGIRVKLQSPQGERRLFFDLNLHNNVVRPEGTIAIRSYWQGHALLNGSDVQVGLIDGITTAGTPQRTYLLIRPWSERHLGFAVENRSVETVNFCPNLFFGKQGYEVHYEFVANGAAPAFKLQFTERAAQLGEVKITGEHIKRLVLTGSQTANAWNVVLDRPDPVVRIPVGTYTWSQARLAADRTEAYLEPPRFSPYQPSTLTVNATKSATLVIGGPLTNTVSVARQGRALSFSYQLLGADGRSYQLVGSSRDKPPRYAVVKDGKEIASGNFEFG